MFIIVGFSVALRLASRRLAREFFIDDVLIYLATLTSLALLVPHLIAIQNGFGKHYYDLPDGALTRIVEPSKSNPGMDFLSFLFFSLT